MLSRSRRTAARALAVALLAGAGVGTGAAPAAAAPLPLTVAAVEAPAWYVQRAGTATYHVDVTNDDAEAAALDVSMFASSLPTGVSAGFAPLDADIAPGATVRYAVTLTATSSAPIAAPVTATFRASAGLTATGSSAWQVAAADVPGAPPGVSAARGDRVAHVSWGVPPANNRPIQAFQVVASPGGATMEVGAATTGVTMTGLTNGVTYTFAVRARNVYGFGQPTASNPATPAGVPAQVTGVSAAAGNATATVTWAAADGNGSPVTGYVVAASPGTATATAGGTATSVDVTGLANGTAYTFTVRAVNAVGDGAPSDPSAPVTPDGVAPVVTVAAQPAFTLAGTVGVSYAATDAGTGVTTYDVRYRVASYTGVFGSYRQPAGWQGIAATSVSRAATRGYTFCFSVRARDAAGNVAAWSPDRCVASPLDDRALARSAGWSSGSSASYYAGTYTATTRKGATLTEPGVRARRVALVATKCSTCGSVGVYLNGVLKKTVSLKATKTAYRQVVVVDLGALKTGDITLKTLNTGRVYVDGFGVSRV